MKRLILLFVFSIVFMPCYAQLNIQSNNSKQFLGYLTENSQRVVKIANAYYLEGDLSYYGAPAIDRNTNLLMFFDFCLGNNKSSSIQTLKDLVAICDNTSNVDYDVKDAKGKNATIRKYSIDPRISITMDFQQGMSGRSQYYTKEQLQLAIDLISRN